MVTKLNSIRFARRSFALLLTLVLCLSLITTAFAATGGTEVKPSGSAVFTNDKEESTGLRVIKTVQSSESSIPDAEFYFMIQVGEDNKTPGPDSTGRDNSIYVWYDASGNEIGRYIDVYSKAAYDLTEAQFNAAPNKATLAKVDRHTNADGSFTLRDGESAFFTEMAPGTKYKVMETGYKIEEDPAPGKFEQIDPAPDGEDSARVGILDEYREAGFVNFYTKNPPPPPPGQVVPTTLEIVKSVQTAEGFEQPDASFEFTVKCVTREGYPGTPVANNDYVLFDMTDGYPGVEIPETAEDVHRTDAAGKLKLKANQRAVLIGIEVGKEYQVTEGTTAGWERIVPTDTDTVELVTALDGNRVSFTNRNVVFGVSKAMADGSETSESFTFKLTDQNNANIQNAEYYLYNSKDKRLVETSTFETDSFGEFHLYADQTAMFVSLPDTVTQFNISENTMSGFKQVVPAESDGYTNQSVGSAIIVYPFTNKVDDDLYKLLVRKVVVSEDGDAASLADKEFTFQLLRGDTPLPDQSYLVNGYSKTTAADGTFKLKSNETAEFYGRIPKQEYTVREILTGDDEKDYIIHEGNPQSGVMTEAGLDFMFTNNYKSFMDLTLTKVRAEDSEPLPFVGFELTRLLPAGGTDTSFPVQELETDENGKCVLTNLRSGTYCLKETSNPYYLCRSFEFALDVHNKSIEVKKVLDENGEDISTELSTYVLESAVVDGAAKLTVANIPNDKLAFVIAKQDANTGAALAGAVFQINGKGLPESGDDVYTVTTDENGIAQIPGKLLFTGEKYTIKEIKAPAGYTISGDATKTVKVAKDGSINADKVVEINGVEVPAVIFKDKPIGSTSTGDDSNLGLWTALMLVSAVSAAVVFSARRKKMQ